MTAPPACHLHSHQRQGAGKTGRAKDPICGIVVPKATALSTQRGGRNYYVCSQSCLQTFQNPDQELGVIRRRVGFVDRRGAGSVAGRRLCRLGGGRQPGVLGAAPGPALDELGEVAVRARHRRAVHRWLLV